MCLLRWAGFFGCRWALLILWIYKRQNQNPGLEKSHETFPRKLPCLCLSLTSSSSLPSVSQPERLPARVSGRHCQLCEVESRTLLRFLFTTSSHRSFTRQLPNEPGISGEKKYLACAVTSSAPKSVNVYKRLRTQLPFSASCEFTTTARRAEKTGKFCRAKHKPLDLHQDAVVK